MNGGGSAALLTPLAVFSPRDPGGAEASTGKLILTGQEPAGRAPVGGSDVGLPAVLERGLPATPSRHRRSHAENPVVALLVGEPPPPPPTAPPPRRRGRSTPRTSNRDNSHVPEDSTIATAESFRSLRTLEDLVDGDGLRVVTARSQASYYQAHGGSFDGPTTAGSTGRRHADPPAGGFGIRESNQIPTPRAAVGRSDKPTPRAGYGQENLRPAVAEPTAPTLSIVEVLSTRQKQQPLTAASPPAPAAVRQHGDMQVYPAQVEPPKARARAKTPDRLRRLFQHQPEPGNLQTSRTMESRDSSKARREKAINPRLGRSFDDGARDEKRGFFGKLFGRKKKPEKNLVQEVDSQSLSARSNGTATTVSYVATGQLSGPKRPAELRDSIVPRRDFFPEDDHDRISGVGGRPASIFMGHDEVSVMTIPTFDGHPRQRDDPAGSVPEPVGLHWNIIGKADTIEEDGYLDPFKETFDESLNGSPPRLKEYTDDIVHEPVGESPLNNAKSAESSQATLKINVQDPSPRGFLSPVLAHQFLNDPVGESPLHKQLRGPAAVLDGSPYAQDPPRYLFNAESELMTRNATVTEIEAQTKSVSHLLVVDSSTSLLRIPPEQPAVLSYPDPRYDRFEAKEEEEQLSVIAPLTLPPPPPPPPMPPRSSKAKRRSCAAKSSASIGSAVSEDEGTKSGDTKSPSVGTKVPVDMPKTDVSDTASAETVDGIFETEIEKKDDTVNHVSEDTSTSNETEESDASKSEPIADQLLTRTESSGSDVIMEKSGINSSTSSLTCISEGSQMPMSITELDESELTVKSSAVQKELEKWDGTEISSSNASKNSEELPSTEHGKHIPADADDPTFETATQNREVSINVFPLEDEQEAKNSYIEESSSFGRTSATASDSDRSRMEQSKISTSDANEEAKVITARRYRNSFALTQHLARMNSKDDEETSQSSGVSAPAKKDTLFSDMQTKSVEIAPLQFLTSHNKSLRMVSGQSSVNNDSSKTQLTVSAAARMNARALAFLHSMNGAPSPRHELKRSEAYHLSASSPADSRQDESRSRALGSNELETRERYLSDSSEKFTNCKLFSAYSGQFKGRKPLKSHEAKISLNESTKIFKVVSSETSIAKPDEPPVQFRKGAMTRDVSISYTGVRAGFALRRQKRNADISSGRAQRVVPQQQPKPLKVQSSFNPYEAEPEPQDPIQRAGRRLIIRAAVRVQAVARRFLAEKEAVDRLWATMEIQSYVRRWRAETYFLASRNAAQVIQSLYRGFVVRKSVKAKITASIEIQRIFRGYISALHVYEEVYNIILVQARVRGIQSRTKLSTQISCAQKLQALARGVKTRTELSRMKESATLLQATWRMYQIRQCFQFLVVDVIICQSIVRRWRDSRFAAITKEKRLREAAVKIQRQWQTYCASTKLKRNEAAAKIQSVVRMISLRTKYSEALRQCEEDRALAVVVSKIQAVSRGFLGYTQYRRYKAARVIQSLWRGFQAYTDFIFILVDIIIIQRTMRRFLAMKRVENLRKNLSATKIQSLWRGRNGRQSLKEQISATRRTNQGIAATKIQAAWKGFWLYSHFVIMRYETVRLQAVIRGRAAVKRYNLILGCCIMIQNTFRRYLGAKRKTQKLLEAALVGSSALRLREKNAATVIQIWWRVVVECRKEKKAALVIEKFFLMVKDEVDREILRVKERHKAKKERRRKKKENKYVELNDSTRHVDSLTLPVKRRTPVGGNMPASKEPEKNAVVRHAASSPSMKLVMRHDYETREMPPRVNDSFVPHKSVARQLKSLLDDDKSVDQNTLTQSEEGESTARQVETGRARYSSAEKYRLMYGIKTEPSSSTKRNHFFSDSASGSWDRRRSASPRSNFQQSRSHDRTSMVSPRLSQESPRHGKILVMQPYPESVEKVKKYSLVDDDDDDLEGREEFGLI